MVGKIKKLLTGLSTVLLNLLLLLAFLIVLSGFLALIYFLDNMRFVIKL